MLLDVFRKFNWVDIFVIISLVRIGYVSFKTGFTIELFKLLGIILATYISLHYYIRFSDLIFHQGASSEKMPVEFSDFISFMLLAIAGYMFFVLLRSVFYRFMKMEAAPTLQKWGGLVLGMVRGFLFVGLITFMFVTSSIAYLKDSVQSSYSGSSTFKIAPSTYSWIWNNLSSKFMDNEKFNQTVIEVQEKESPKQ